MSRTGWTLVALSCALALGYGLFGPTLYAGFANASMLAAFKASAIVLLAGVALMHRAQLLAIALLLGAAGDALLALGEATFLPGAGAFLAGHLVYIAVFTRAGIGMRAALSQPSRVVAMLALIVAAVASTALLVPRASAMFVPLCFYTSVLTLMAMSAFTLPWSRWLAMLGGVLFFVSDGFVAANMFHPQTDPSAAFWMSFVGWIVYWTGQAGLCLGAVGLHKPSP